MRQLDNIVSWVNELWIPKLYTRESIQSLFEESEFDPFWAINYSINKIEYLIGDLNKYSGMLQSIMKEKDIGITWLLILWLKRIKEVKKLIQDNSGELPKGYKRENVLYLLFFVWGPIVFYSGLKKRHLLTKLEMKDSESKLLVSTWALSMSMYLVFFYYYSTDFSAGWIQDESLIEVFKYYWGLLEKYSPVVYIRTIVMLLYDVYMLAILWPNVVRLLEETSSKSKLNL